MVQNVCCLFPQGICHADNAGQYPAYGEIEVGVLLRQRVKGFLLLRRDDAPLVLKDKVIASDDHLFPVDETGDTVSHHILHLGVHLLVRDSPTNCLLDHGVCHGMGVMLLQAGGHPENLLPVPAAEGDDLCYCGSGVGQRTRLVKDNGVRFGHGLQVFAALHRNVIAAALPHGGEDGQGHGQLQGAGEIHHQNGDSPGDISGQQIGQGRSGQAVGHQPVCQLQRPAFRCGFQLLGFLDHGDDLVIAAGAGLLLHLDDAFPFLHNRTGVDTGPRSLSHSQGFAGERGLVDEGLAGEDPAVQGDHIAGVDADGVAGLHLTEGHQHLGIPGFQPDPLHIQGHAAGQVT